uniref:Uncharacterized protein n=1 Tax=Babesia bovis TaxID=5865 RepID=S6B3G7_BABBO|nr:hypothetical protein [Babesia bovis]
METSIAIIFLTNISPTSLILGNTQAVPSRGLTYAIIGITLSRRYVGNTAQVGMSSHQTYLLCQK